MQRSDDRERDRLSDLDVGLEGGAAVEEKGDAGRRSRLESLFSVRACLVSLVVLAVGLLAGGFVPLLGGVLRFAGLFAGAFALGLLWSRRHYLEVGFAGAVVSGLGFLLSAFETVLLPIVANYGVEIAGVGVGAGLLVSVAGYYFGRDLRDGLTRDL